MPVLFTNLAVFPQISREI